MFWLLRRCLRGACCLTECGLLIAVGVQLFLFHLLSFPVVGFFYPTLMYSMLTIFILVHWKRKAPSTLEFLMSGRPALSTYGLIVVFSLFQLIPRLMPGDTAITGEGRLFSLHMFDAYTSCEAHAMVKSRVGPPREVNLYIPLAVRIHCDPIVYLDRAHKLCEKERRGNRFFMDLDLSLRTRRAQSDGVQAGDQRH